MAIRFPTPRGGRFSAVENPALTGGAEVRNNIFILFFANKHPVVDNLILVEIVI